MRWAVDMAKAEWQAGKHKPAEQGSAGKRSRRTLRPAQALKKQTASWWPALQQKQQPMTWLASRRAVQVSGGSTVVLAAKKAGADLPTCLYPT